MSPQINPLVVCPRMVVSGLLLTHFYKHSAEEDRFGVRRSYLKGDMYKLILNLNHSDGAFAL